MHQGNKSSKLIGGGREFPKKNSSSSAIPRLKKLSVKTKFTLQCDSTFNKAVIKRSGRKSYNILNIDKTRAHYSKLDLPYSVLEERLSEENGRPTISSRHSKIPILRCEEKRKVNTARNSVPFIVSSTKMVKSSSVTYNNVASVRKTTRCPHVSRETHGMKRYAVSVKTNVEDQSNRVMEYESTSRSRIELKESLTKTTTIKKSTTYPPEMNLTKSVCKRKSFTGCRTCFNQDFDTKSIKEFCFTDISQARNICSISRPEETKLKDYSAVSQETPGAAFSKDIDRDVQDMKTLALNLIDNSVISASKNARTIKGETESPCGHEEKICEANKDSDVEYKLPKIKASSTQIACKKNSTKNQTFVVHNSTLTPSRKELYSDRDDLDVTLKEDNPEADSNIFHERSSADNYGFESLEKQNSNEELLNLDKRIWSDLKVQIRETFETTDFLCASEDASEESLSDIMNELLGSLEEKETVTEMVTENSSENGRYSQMSVAKSKTSSFSSRTSQEDHVHTNLDEGLRRKPIQALEAPEPRNPTEEPKAKVKEAKPNKSTEQKTVCIEIVPENVDLLKLRNGINKPNTSVTELKETVGRNNCKQSITPTEPVNPAFFKSHNNIGFIGRSIDEGFVSFDLGEVKLYQPPEGQMLFHDIANCVATQAYLKMCGIKYDTEFRKNAEQMSPSGRVPFICSGLCIIPEFEAIVSFMQYKKFTCINVEESDKQAFRSMLSMVIDVLEVSERYICWHDKTTLLKYTKPRVGGYFPFPLNHIMNWKKRFEERRFLADKGISGKSFDMILKEINSCFENLSQRLGDNTFFFGNTCTELDALVYGHIYALFTVELEGPFRDIQFILQQFPNLLAFAVAFDKTFELNKFYLLDVSYWDTFSTTKSNTSLCTKV